MWQSNPLAGYHLAKNTKHKGKEYFCMNCLQEFNEESSRDEHLDYCINNESETYSTIFR